MRCLKTLAAVLLVALTLGVVVNAEHLPEKNLIGTTVVVEDDRSVVEDNLKDHHGFDPEDYTATVMTKPRFFIICTAPALIVAASGCVLLLAFELHARKKSNRSQN